MGAVIVFYLGRALQVMGMITATAALIVYGGVEGGMGPMMKLAGAGLVEFYVGYGLLALAGRKG